MRRLRPIAGSVVLIRTGNGIGDALLLSAVAEQIHAQFPQLRLRAVSRFPELYHLNPAFERGYRLPAWFPDRLGKYLHLPGFCFVGYEYGAFPPREHLARAMCRSVGIEPRGEVRPHLFLSAAELAACRVKFALPEQFIAMQSTAGSSWAAGNKNWSAGNWQAAAGQLGDEMAIVQVGLATDPRLPKALDLCGQTGLREVGCVLRQSRCFVGQEGGLHHLAAAVGTRAVLVYSGYVTPEISSYEGNINIHRPVECSPCWLRTPCPRGLRCLATIGVAEVVAAVRGAVRR